MYALVLFLRLLQIPNSFPLPFFFSSKHFAVKLLVNWSQMYFVIAFTLSSIGASSELITTGINQTEKENGEKKS